MNPHKPPCPKGGAPKRGGPKISRFFPSPTTIFSLFCVSLGVFSWNFGGVKRRDPEQCTFGVLGLSCEATAAPMQPPSLAQGCPEGPNQQQQHTTTHNKPTTEQQQQQHSNKFSLQVDVLLSEEPLIRANIGRPVFLRMEPDQPSSDVGNVLSATVPASSGALRATGCEHGSRVTCPVTPVSDQAGVTCQNRFAPLGEDADGVPVPSRPEEFAMTECSDTESCELVERHCRRLRLTWNASAPDVVRERRDRAVHAASDFLSSVVERVGPVDMVGEVPREVRRLRW